MWLGHWRAKTLGTLRELPLRLSLPRVTVAVPEVSRSRVTQRVVLGGPEA